DAVGRADPSHDRRRSRARAPPAGAEPRAACDSCTAHNPDTFFQARETVNPHYLATPGIVQRAMDRLAALTGRQYRLFRYDGHPDAERVVVAMGSSAEILRATVAHLNAQGERVGVIQVLLYRPWSAKGFLAALPANVRRIAVLDRTKEPGAPAEPLCL